MEAILFEGPFRYRVPSEKNSEKDYIADLRDWSCSCSDYYFRVRLLQKKTGKKRSHYCKHLRTAMAQFALDNLDTYIELIEERERQSAADNTVHGGQRIDDDDSRVILD